MTDTASAPTESTDSDPLLTGSIMSDKGVQLLMSTTISRTPFSYDEVGQTIFIF